MVNVIEKHLDLLLGLWDDDNGMPCKLQRTRRKKKKREVLNNVELLNHNRQQASIKLRLKYQNDSAHCLVQYSGCSFCIMAIKCFQLMI